MVSGVYIILNVTNGKCYVGSSINVYARMESHRKCLVEGTHLNRHLQSSWDKYGPASFKFKVVALCEEMELLDEEQTMIDVLRTVDPAKGYNGRGAGPRGRHGLNARAKLRAAMLGTTLSSETRAKMSAAGRRRFQDPKVRAVFRESMRCLETRAKMSMAHMGKRLSPEIRTKMSVAHQGKPWTAIQKEIHGRPEVRAKKSAAHLGKKTGPRKPETCAKISAALQGKLLTLEHRANIGVAFRGKPWSAARRKAYENSR